MDARFFGRVCRTCTVTSNNEPRCEPHRCVARPLFTHMVCPAHESTIFLTMRQQAVACRDGLVHGQGPRCVTNSVGPSPRVDSGSFFFVYRELSCVKFSVVDQLLGVGRKKHRVSRYYGRRGTHLARAQSMSSGNDRGSHAFGFGGKRSVNIKLFPHGLQVVWG
jgi:hypothetical protein